jgi:hypothetical protein
VGAHRQCCAVVGNKSTGGTFTPASRRILMITQVLLIGGALLTTAGHVIRIATTCK